MIGLVVEVPYWYFTIEIRAQKQFEKENNDKKGKDNFTSI